MKKIGFLSFGHWTSSPSSQVRSASDALVQSLELAVAAEEVGADGAYFRVHHFARQLASPFPLLAAIGARTRGSRSAPPSSTCATRTRSTWSRTPAPPTSSPAVGCSSGISRGSPEQVIDGWRYFGYQPAEGESDTDMARRHTQVFLEVLKGRGSPNRTLGRCSPTLRACSRSSRTRQACATGSGGAQDRPRPQPGRQRWA